MESPATHFDDRDARAKTGRSLVRMRIVNERTLNLPVGETRDRLLGAIEGHILGQGRLMGRYQRQ